MIKKALVKQVNTVYTSSMGRLFDVVSSLLGICQRNEYEGQCATLLQYQAEEEAKASIPALAMSFRFDVEKGMCIFGYEDILEKCMSQKRGAALGFHYAICDMVEEMCLRLRQSRGIPVVALSGGVFQNSFLLELVTKRLSSLDFLVFTNEAVPCNDGGIALGQAFLAAKTTNLE
jgi:hydrogenase maturation protein HypF